MGRGSARLGLTVRGRVCLGGLLVALSLAPGVATPVAAAVSVGYTSVPVVLDGRLDEWRWPVGEWATLAWDKSYLYLGVQVSDPSLEVADDRSRDFAGSDRVVLAVSTVPEAVPSAGGKLGEGDFAFVFTPDSVYRRPLKTVYSFGGYEHADLDLRLVGVAASVTADGYILEARVPWGVLGLEPKAGLPLGLEILAYDVRPAGQVRRVTRSGQPAGETVGRQLLKPALLTGE